jgi:hypothetical protein
MSGVVRKLYTQLFGDAFVLRAYQRTAIELTIARAMGGRTSLLDVGAGELGLTAWLKRRHPDWQMEACDLRFSGEARTIAAANGLILHVTDGNWLPSTPGGYDVILLSSVLQMVPQPSGLLALCREALKVDTGRVVLTVPAEYHFLPRLCSSANWPAGWIRRVCRLPDSTGELQEVLKRRFGVQGRSGQYTDKEIVQLLEASGFSVVTRQRTPGWFGTLAWETSLLLSVRMGPKAYALMGLVYPLVRLGDGILGSRWVGEHLMVIAPYPVAVRPA